MNSRTARILLLLAIVWLGLSLFGCGGGGGGEGDIGDGGGAVDPGLFTPNYVTAILDSPDPKAGVYHWSHFPVLVSFHLPDNWQALYGDDADLYREAAGEWSYGGVEFFKIVQWGFPSDVTVEFVNQTELGGNVWGSTAMRFYQSNNEMDEAPIRVALYDSALRVTNAGDLKVLIAHELGHALGIGGHSPENSDLMYFQHVFGTLRPATASDINTARTAYPSYFGIPMVRSEGVRTGEPVTMVIE